MKNRDNHRFKIFFGFAVEATLVIGPQSNVLRTGEFDLGFESRVFKSIHTINSS